MEGQVISDIGLEKIGNILASGYDAEVFKIRLFKSDTVPTRTTVLADLDECDFDGYAAQDLASWIFDTVTAHVGYITYPPVTFTRSAGATSNNVFGYYITDAANTELYWTERAVPAADHVGTVMSIPTQTIVVTPKQTVESKFP